MSWECGCGIVNRESRVKCSGCGTPKGMVWTPIGFKTAEEAASLGEIRQKQGYLFGWYFVAVFSLVAIFLLPNALAGPDATVFAAAFLICVFWASAAGLRKPWGWYVLVVGVGAPMSPLFVYFYKRRAMFGAKGRWKWFERTFPNFVGPEDVVPVPMTEPAGKGRALQMGASQDAVQRVAKTASPTKAPEYPNHDTRIQLWKKCPRCAEKCYLEDTRCRHCDHQFDTEELARLISQIFDEHKEQFSRYVDFNSETKQCPACAETIKLEALMCRYCRRDFTSIEVQISKMRVFRQKAMGTAALGRDNPL